MPMLLVGAISPVVTDGWGRKTPFPVFLTRANINALATISFNPTWNTF